MVHRGESWTSKWQKRWMKQSGGAQARTRARRRGAQTILLVEDEAFVREVTCEVLRSAGYRVLTAKNATEAMQAYEVRGDEVDLLLSDVVLPGESGRVLAGKLRRENPWLKILLVTGYAEQMGAAGRDAGGMLGKAIFY